MLTANDITKRVKDAVTVSRYKSEEFLCDITKPGISGAGGSWVFPDLLIWFYACENPGLLSELNDRIAATVRGWCADHIEELGGQYAQSGKAGKRVIDRGDGKGLVPMDLTDSERS